MAVDRLQYMRNYYHSHKSANRLKTIWYSMLQRCKPGHKYYGDKGIRVCDEWHDFNVFKAWALSNGYDRTLTIDRINGRLGYFPDNCRWATRKEQQRNTSYTVNIELNGEFHCIREWAEITGISESALRNRFRRNWSIERALTTPTKKHKRSNKNGC